jgi:hypothetical protein
MTRCRLALIAMVTLLLGGCSTLDAIKNINVGNDFEKDSRAYLQLIRWHELESAVVTYVSVPVQKDYRKRIEAAGDVHVADYRIKSMECDPENGEAKLKVEFDYYRPPSTRVLTVVDNQKWSYEGQEGGRSWRLQTLLPEFK